MTRRRSPSTCGTMAIGVILAPILGLVSLFGLVLAAEAMGMHSLTQLGEAADGFLAQAGLVYAPTEPMSTEEAPAAFAYGPPATIAQPEPFQPLPITQTPTPTSSPTPSASPTMTPSSTPTETPTPTASLTPTESPSPTSLSTPRFAPTATRTRPPTRIPTRTPTRTTIPRSSATVAGTPTGAAPTDASDAPPTMDGATAEVPPTVAASTLTPTARPSASSCDAAASSSVEAQVIALINEERVDRGLTAYSVDSRLTAAARLHATDMACNHFTSHTGSDGSSVRDRVERQGYDWSWIGENYFVGSGSAQTAFDWWMNSAPHTANILSPNYTQFGVGYVYDADSDHGGYFVVVFARPG